MKKISFSYFPPKFTKRRIYYKLVFLIYFFLHSCSTPSSLDSIKSKQAEAFLEELLFVEGGCFTLLGDKPITSMLIYKGNPKDSYLEGLSAEALGTLEYIDSHTAENFEAWKQVTKNIQQNHFFFVEIPLENDPTCTSLYFINVFETEKAYRKLSDKISKKLGVHDWNSLLQELKKPNIKLWQGLFKDHYISGIFYGYGEENSQIFSPNQKGVFSSKDFQGKITKEHFPIPTYVVSTKDRTSKKYKTQANQIKKLYKNKNILKETLKYLH